MFPLFDGDGLFYFHSQFLILEPLRSSQQMAMKAMKIIAINTLKKNRMQKMTSRAKMIKKVRSVFWSPSFSTMIPPTQKMKTKSAITTKTPRMFPSTPNISLKLYLKRISNDFMAEKILYVFLFSSTIIVYILYKMSSNF